MWDPRDPQASHALPTGPYVSSVSWRVAHTLFSWNTYSLKAETSVAPKLLPLPTLLSIVHSLSLSRIRDREAVLATHDSRETSTLIVAHGMW